MASYPGSVKTFSARSAGQTIEASHVGDLQDEVNAIEAGLLNGTAPVNSSNSTAATLTVTGQATLGGLVVITDAIEPTALSTGDTHNWNPSGLSSAFYIRITGNSSGSTLTGMHMTALGEVKVLYNVGAAVIGLKHADGNSSADARFAFPNSSNYALQPNEAITLYKDPISPFWVKIG